MSSSDNAPTKLDEDDASMLADEDDDIMKPTFSVIARHVKKPFMVRSCRDARYTSGFVWSPSSENATKAFLMLDGKTRDKVSMPSVEELGNRLIPSFAKLLARSSRPSPEPKIAPPTSYEFA